MSANWNVVGQVGTVEQKGKVWVVNVADNRYEGNRKVDVVWFHLICKFKPKVKKGDTVIASGIFEPSNNKGFQYAMICEHIGMIGHNGSGEVPPGQEAAPDEGVPGPDVMPEGGNESEAGEPVTEGDAG